MLAWAQDFRDVHPPILHFPAFRSCWLGPCTPNATHSWGQLAKARKVQKTRGNLRNACRSAGLPRRPPSDSSLSSLPVAPPCFRCRSCLTIWRGNGKFLQSCRQCQKSPFLQTLYRELAEGMYACCHLQPKWNSSSSALKPTAYVFNHEVMTSVWCSSAHSPSCIADKRELG